MWLKEIASTLRSSRLHQRAGEAPTRGLPDLAFRFLALFAPELRMLVPELGRRNAQSSEKARRLLGFSPRPATTTVVDCAESLVGGRE